MTDPSVAVRTIPRQHGHMAAIASGLAVVAAAYHSTVAALFDTWTAADSAQNHGLLLAAVCGYLLVIEWRARRGPVLFRGARTPFLAIPVLGACWLLARVGHVQGIEETALLLLPAFLLAGLLGWSQNPVRYLFPVLLPIAALPIWEPLNTYTQQATATVVAWTVRVIGYPLTQDGFVLHVPAGTFAVTEYCSGLAYQSVAVTLALLLAYTHRLSLGRAAPIVIASWSLAFLVNVVRVGIVVVVGQTRGVAHPLVNDHKWLGWLLFAVSIVPWLMVVQRRASRDVPAAPEALDAPAVGADFPYGRFGSLVACAIAAPLLHLGLSFIAPHTAVQPALALPAALGEWQAAPWVGDGWTPVWVGPTRSARQAYRRPAGMTVEVFLFRYDTQEQGREAVSAVNRPYDLRVWSEKRRAAVEIEVRGRPLAIRECVVGSGGAERLVWSWYYVTDRHVASTVSAKALNVIGTLTGRPAITAVVLGVRTGAAGDSPQATLRDFLDAAILPVEGLLDAERRRP